MSDPITRAPYDHALAEINTTADNLRGIETMPSGHPRNLDGPTAIGALTVRSNLAIASALLAIADAVRTSSESAPIEVDAPRVREVAQEEIRKASEQARRQGPTTP